MMKSIFMSLVSLVAMTTGLSVAEARYPMPAPDYPVVVVDMNKPKSSVVIPHTSHVIFKFVGLDRSKIENGKTMYVKTSSFSIMDRDFKDQEKVFLPQFAFCPAQSGASIGDAPALWFNDNPSDASTANHIWFDLKSDNSILASLEFVPKEKSFFLTFSYPGHEEIQFFDDYRVGGVNDRYASYICELPVTQVEVRFASH